MKRSFIALMLLLTFTAVASAQTGLNINKIFGGKYVSDPKVTETLMSGKHRFLRENDLTMFATFKGPAATYASIIEPLVLADGAKSVGKNVRYKDGKLYFAFFILQPLTQDGKKENRYLYYLNNAAHNGNNVLVVYLEGKISQDEANSIIKRMAKNVK